MNTSIHISGIHATVFFLMMVAVFGALHLIASAHPSATLSRAWMGLGF